MTAAALVVREEGAAALTLERVAARAGVSKGGLLHHFRTKEELVRGMMEAKMDAWEACLEARVAAGERYARAYVEDCFDKDPETRDLAGVFVAAVATDRSLAGVVEARFDTIFARLVADGLAPHRARLLVLASDGLFLSASLGIRALPDAELVALRREMLRLLKPAEDDALAPLLRHALACAG